jgi:glycosyltransferase involved in cell wall biosynthesis
MRKKIALFHPWIKSRGGAERVVLEIAKSKRFDVDVYTWVYDSENTFSDFKDVNVKVIAPRFLKRMSRMHILRGLFLFVGLFGKIPLEKYDKFLISTSGVGEFVALRNRKLGKTYAYIHTPLREVDDKIISWNLKNKYQNRFFSRFLYMLSIKMYKILEAISWKNIDFVIFNSNLSLSRAQKRNLVLNKNFSIIYPPIDYKRFRYKVKETKKQFFYLSRLNPPKRQDVLVEAWKKFSKKHPEYKLILIGTPDNKKYVRYLEKLSGNLPSIEIIKNADDKEVSKIVSQSEAGIFLGYQEDFGIVPIEIISSGKPLIAVDEGGYVDIIKNNELFYKIKERHDNKKMINEINNSLEKFVLHRKKYKNSIKIKKYNFMKELETSLM